jgi:hypothetical protein
MGEPRQEHILPQGGIPAAMISILSNKVGDGPALRDLGYGEVHNRAS